MTDILALLQPIQHSVSKTALRQWSRIIIAMIAMTGRVTMLGDQFALILKRLEADGNITSYWGDETQGGRRRYYRITKKGRQVYSENKDNWEYAKRILDQLL